ncbi:MAG TPA: Rieske 2Fe-2S domain-containing protein [Verrucomicrobiae bacterium]|nr:Rieske 2Fe-2S domain-containing protein [Verrucomicrobiae bacterium]
MTEISQADPHAAAAEDSSLGMLWDFWYPAIRSRELSGRALRKAALLEVPLCIGRDAHGKPFALRDICPHRGMPLSYGQFDGACVECSYHGWKFDGHTGQCREIPSITSDSKLRPDRIYAGAFPCEERDGYIWVYMSAPNSPRIARRQGEPEEKEQAPVAAPELPKFGGRYRIAHLSAEMPVHVDHGVIGLMDPAHGPFVHQSWWWRSRRSIHEKQKKFEPIPAGFRMSPHTPSSNSLPYKILKLITGAPVTTTIDFTLPSYRFEQVRSGKLWFSSRAVVTPVRRDLCRLDFCAAWNVLPFVPVISFIIRVLGPRFIAQDTDTMTKQAEGLRTNPHLMLIDDADRPAKWYFQLKAAHLESKRTGVRAAHPMDGPVTLRWRS